MARIVFGTYLVRYPLGGMITNVLEYLVGLRRLGHDIHVVEKAGYPNACFDPSRKMMTDDGTFGCAVAAEVLGRIGLGDRWCYVDAEGAHHGMQKQQVTDAFDSADLFIDYGAHGSWNEEADAAGVTSLIDGEPGYSQIRMKQQLARGEFVPEYDRYFTVGRNIGTSRSPAPTADRDWHHLFHPVSTDRFAVVDPPPGAAITTVMNWRSHDEVEWLGRRYGQKDREFDRFVDLPLRASVPIEVGVSGQSVPKKRLLAAQWLVRDAHEITETPELFLRYIDRSLAEFSVCKHVFVALNTGWFSDRSAVYLASGRPVILQDTGFSEHLPTGRGLFAVRSVEEAADAVERIRLDWKTHSRAAREVARSHLEARTVLRRLLADVGIS